jgi:hypothetical protein
MVFVLFAAAWAQPWKLLAQNTPAAAPQPATGIKYAAISPDEMKEWLTYLSSDQLQGRQIFTEGFGLAAQYVADHLKQWGVKPLATDGTYFQPVKLKAYRVTRNSTVTVEVNGQAKTFKHGDHVTFPVNGGGNQTLAFSGVEFVGYGQANDFQGRDLKDKLVVTIPNLAPPPAAAQRGRGAAPATPPAATPPAATTPAASAPPAAASPVTITLPASVLDAIPGGNAPRGGAAARGGPAGAIALGAKATIGFTPTAAAPSAAEQSLVQAQAALTQANAALVQAQQALRGGGAAGGARGAVNVVGGRGAQPAAPADITTVQRVDGIVTPQFSGDETFFEALFDGGSVKFADVLAAARRGEPIAPITLPAKVTVNIDNTFVVLSEQISHNVVGMIEGTDPVLKDTYVMFGAHLDHIGYSQTGTGRGGGTDGCRRRSPVAQAAVVAAGKTVQRPAAGGQGGAQAARGAAAATPAVPAVPLDQRDLVSNGADDDGSGSTAELAIAKAFATGPKPKRSIVFMWHTGEEAGLYGSRYNADFPVVPLEKVQAQLNLDMVGRDDCNDIEGDYSNSLFVIGDDRISTDLHNLIVATNNISAKPLTLDYEMNDPNDPESVYTRSDHYSYASKGIPIAFFTTGLHPDYHRITDTVDKIIFPKMARIAQLVYETGFSVANTDRVLVRDNKGPRTGFASKAEIIPR